MEVQFSLAMVCSKLKDQDKRLVGRLGEGWVVREEGQLLLASSLRLRESFLFSRLLASHEVARERLKESLDLYPGGPLEAGLAEVCRSLVVNDRRCPAMVTDRRITHNGLEVGLYQRGGEGGWGLKLEAVREGCSAGEGVRELEEVLRRIQGGGGEDSLAASRYGA